MPTRKITVTGKVQGVGFRRFAVNEGRKLGLSVKAENHSDGSMSATADGKRAGLDFLKIRMRQGPAGARVDSLEEHEIESYKNKTVCIVDNGDYTSIAETLAKSFGRTYYYTPRADPCYPSSSSEMVGSGLPGVTRILDMWAKNVFDEVDLWVFLDIYDGNLQMHLQDLGKRVWGSRNGDELENDRELSKKHLKSLGLKVGPYKIVEGIENLRAWLKMHENQWVKIERTRGDMETFFSKNHKEIEPVVDRLAYKLGEKKQVMRFYCEDEIKDAVEIAYDGYTVDGQFPDRSLVGIEIKNKAYASNVRESKDWPKQVRELNEKLSPALKGHQYRNFFCFEMRVTKDGTPWPIDACCRMPLPPGELQQMMIGNLPEIFWYGAEGKLIQPEMAAKAGVEVIIRSGWAEENWQSLSFPEKIRENVKLRRHCIMNGRDYVVPISAQVAELGGIVAVGDSIEEAAKEVKKLVKQVEGHGLEMFPDALDEAGEEFEKIAKFGIKL